MLSVFGLIAWLTGREIERVVSSLTIAKNALENHNKYIEMELILEKEKLRQSQIDELQSIYRFAEVGRKTSMLLHNLANQVTELSLEIPDSSEDKAVIESRKSIDSINRLIRQVKNDIKPGIISRIKLKNLLIDMAEKLSDKSKKEKVEITVQNTDSLESLSLDGDLLQLSLALEVLISNAVEAYRRMRRKRKRVVILSCNMNDGAIDISVQDFGEGIPTQKKASLFKTTNTTKMHGHGVGLYVAQQIVQHHFNGTIILDDTEKSTVFHIIIPQINNSTSISGSDYTRTTSPTAPTSPATAAHPDQSPPSPAATS